MTEFERAECKAYLLKWIQGASRSLEAADTHKNSMTEQINLMRKLKVYRNLLELIGKRGNKMSKGITPEQAEQARLTRGLDKGTRLRRLRVKRGFSQKELADISGVSMRTLQKYENRESNIDGAKLETLCRLSEALQGDIEAIIESDELRERYNKVR